ncbi:hypothetical protein [Streptomyces chartreusis]|uniref:hypothetical protein n=1 Tax=Streptomyces chartreusis TaxID=1969 RepID=UPI0033AD816D
MRNHAAVSVGKVVGVMAAMAIPFISLPFTGTPAFASTSAFAGTPDTGYAAAALRTNGETPSAPGSDRGSVPPGDGPEGWVWD